jgi:hypothetical protein
MGGRHDHLDRLPIETLEGTPSVIGLVQTPALFFEDFVQRQTALGRDSDQQGGHKQVTIFLVHGTLLLVWISQPCGNLVTRTMAVIKITGSTSRTQEPK